MNEASGAVPSRHQRLSLLDFERCETGAAAAKGDRVANKRSLPKQHEHMGDRHQVATGQTVPKRLLQHRITELPFASRDALRIATLGMHHADPFDFAIIVQALERNLTVITRELRSLRRAGARGLIGCETGCNERLRQKSRCDYA
jgi:hypothetical protein